METPENGSTGPGPVREVMLRNDVQQHDGRQQQQHVLERTKCEKCSNTCTNRLEYFYCPCSELIIYMCDINDNPVCYGDVPSQCAHCICCIPNLVFCGPSLLFGLVIGSCEGLVKCFVSD